jgi:ABC-2 type transport system ATP-binding protein
VLGLNPQKQRKKLSYRIGTVFGQKSQLWFHLPPIDSFLLLSDIYDLDGRQSAKRIEFLTEVFEIGKYLKVPVRKLSLGERIRCEIAASLIHSPEVVFMDEPTIGLDVVVKRRIRRLIKRINNEDNTTIFLTSHDTIDIEKICRRAIVINHGSIVWDNSVKKMKYGFMRKKLIDLRSESPLDISIDGVTIVKTKDYSAKLEVDLDKVDLDDAIELIMKKNRVQDISISDPPMEEVISLIYSER